jgi:hypothetical protein
MSKRKTEELPQEQETWMELDAGLNKIKVGSVPIDKLVRLRTNYREQSSAQRQAMDKSTEKFGFQSLIVVSKLPDGTYSVIDGHHREDVLRFKGAKMAPVILLPEGMAAADLDLGRIAFNISAEVKDDEFASLLRDILSAGGDMHEVATISTVSDKFLEELTRKLDSEPIADTSELDREVLDTGSTKKRKTPRFKVVVLTDTESEEGGVRVCLCSTETIISKEVRECMADLKIAVDEIEPFYFESDEELVELINAPGEEE